MIRSRMAEEEPKPLTSKCLAEIIRRVYEVDPVICPKGGEIMKVINFI